MMVHLADERDLPLLLHQFLLMMQLKQQHQDCHHDPEQNVIQDCGVTGEFQMAQVRVNSVNHRGGDESGGNGGKIDTKSCTDSSGQCHLVLRSEMDSILVQSHTCVEWK